jgi:hypothetical protein
MTDEAPKAPRYSLHWDEDLELVRDDWHPGAVCDAEQARANTADIRALGHSPALILVDMRQMAKLDRGAREHFMADTGTSRAVALLAVSAVTRMMANFFIGMQHGAFPVAVFTDEAKATEWLRAHA